MSEPSPELIWILLLTSGAEAPNDWVSQLDALGPTLVCVDSLEQARQQLDEAPEPIRVVLLDTSLELPNLKKDLKALRGHPMGGMITFVSVGKAPAPAERKRLRSARVELALWEPFDDGTLRFQLNQALNGPRDPHQRRESRVPTYLLARIRCGEREKDAVVYSLSRNGAFLETPRASMEGARVEIELRLPDGVATGPAQVVFSNVPGNLQRPNLPLGIGVRFDDWPREAAKRLANYVQERLSQLNV